MVLSGHPDLGWVRWINPGSEVIAISRTSKRLIRLVWGRSRYDCHRLSQTISGVVDTLPGDCQARIAASGVCIGRVSEYHVKISRVVHLESGIEVVETISIEVEVLFDG